MSSEEGRSIAVRPLVIGVVHVPPLPGAPRYGGDLEAVKTAVLADAEALAYLGYHDRAMEKMQQALDVDPESAVLHLISGNTHLALGDPDAAIREFKLAEQYGMKHAVLNTGMVELVEGDVIELKPHEVHFVGERTLREEESPTTIDDAVENKGGDPNASVRVEVDEIDESAQPDIPKPSDEAYPPTQAIPKKKTLIITWPSAT